MNLGSVLASVNVSILYSLNSSYGGLSNEKLYLNSPINIAFVNKLEVITVVLRDGNKKAFSVKVAKREDERIASGTPGEEQGDELGIQVSELNEEIARRFNIKEENAVIVTGVEPGSKGDEANIVVGDIIKEINHQSIKSVNDYTEAIRKVKEGDYDCVLMDIKMTGMDGMEACKEVTRIKPATKVILMTGYIPLELVEQSSFDGVTDILYKPFNLKQLINSIEGANVESSSR